MTQKQAATTLHLVLSVGYTTDASLFIIAAPIGLFKRENEATMTAQAEQELGEIVVNDTLFKQRTAQSEVQVEGNPDMVWITWSNAFSKDGTGKFFCRIEGAFVTEDAAVAKARSVVQGLQDIKGHHCDVRTEIRRLKVK